MMSPTGVDSDFDNFLTYLNTPTTKTSNRKKMISDVNASDIIVLPHVDAKRSMADARDDIATVSTTKSGGDGDSGFDDFLSYRGAETAPTKKRTVEEASNPSVDSLDDFLSYLGDETSPTKKRTVEEAANPSVDSMEGFLNYLDGGDVPPPPKPAPVARSVAASPAAPSPAPILRRGQREKSVRASPPKKAKTVIDCQNLPVDYFVTLSEMEEEERACPRAYVPSPSRTSRGSARRRPGRSARR